MELEEFIENWITEESVEDDELQSEVLSEEIETDEFGDETTAVDSISTADEEEEKFGDERTVAVDSVSAADEEEDKFVRIMYGDDSKPMKECCKKNCNQKIPKEIALEYRRSIQELGREAQEFVIMGALQSQRRIPELASCYEDARKRKRAVFEDEDCQLKRLDLNYFFHGVSICRDMFLFLHAIGIRSFRSILDHLKDKGIVPREHGLKNKKSKRKNVLRLEDRQHVVDFIKQFGQDNGFPLPGRLKNLKNFEITMLPTLYTQSYVYREYCKGLSDKDKKIHRSMFSKIWKQFCPYIAAAKPSSDLCDKVCS